MLRGGGHEKWPKTAFFAKVPPPRHFCEEKFFRGSTIRKSTSRGFRKCGSFWDLEGLNHSYRNSKLGQGGKSGFVTENKGCHQKLPRDQNFRREVSKYHLKTSLRRNKLLKKMSVHHFFVTSSIFRDEPTFAALSWLWAAITMV